MDNLDNIGIEIGCNCEKCPIRIVNKCGATGALCIDYKPTNCRSMQIAYSIAISKLQNALSDLVSNKPKITDNDLDDLI